VSWLEVSALVSAACERSGCDDFGEDTWQEGLDVLVWALVHEASLNEVGEAVFIDQIVGYLVNRLEVERCYRQHPEIDDQETGPPLVGLGLPRTGSTALSFLLACDRSRRYLRTWEASTPCPPPVTATEDSDPRIAASAAGIEVVRQMFPDFVGMLPSSPTGPQECILLTALDFRSQVFEGMALLPSFTAWLLSCDATPGYRYHRRVLKLLQWQCPPRRWWLKSPAHMTTIEALDRVYPDAHFVMTHRDLGQVLPSVCALKHALSSPLTTELDLHALGKHETDLWSRSLRRTIEFRDDGRDDRFFDVRFDDLQHDPIGAMERLYDAMGDDLTADTRRRMEKWWKESALDRRVGPRPDASIYGLDDEALRSEFAFYNDRFGAS
jgi:Sulfotransferase family